MELRSCKHCSMVFIPKSKRQIHCSLECRIDHIYVLRIITDQKCARCGDAFQSKTPNKYCSRKCQFDKGIRVCQNRKCGKEYKAGTYNQKYCCRDCKPYKSEADKYYQSKEWKKVRAEFIAGFTPVFGFSLSNHFCIQCYRKYKTFVKMYAVDHIVRRKDGGGENKENLQSLCRKHHQIKSAQEGNKRYAKTGI